MYRIEDRHAETGELVEAGMQGEICARGYMLMKGYDGEPEATARAVDSGGLVSHRRSWE